MLGLTILLRPLRIFNPHSRLHPFHRNPNRRSIKFCVSARLRSADVNPGSGDDGRSASFLAQSPLSMSITCSDSSKGSMNGSALDSSKGFHHWDSASEIAALDNFTGMGEIWMVVLLGWLGAEEKHLNRYAEIYSARGIRSVRFVVPLKELVGLDFGRKMEENVGRFTAEIADWCSERERDGRERHLIFHTFSNTGWLVYGLILQNLQSSNEVIEKIKGCVIDSAPAPDLNPKIWAAGFSAAILKKRASSIYPPREGDNGHDAKRKSDKVIRTDLKSQALEMVSMFVLQKILSHVLNFPYVNRRLSEVISILSNKQPLCPQLYLYSSADRVIPASSVETFIKNQKVLGRTVNSFNFGTSPHVDHLRTFPHIYSAQISAFLKRCCAEIGGVFSAGASRAPAKSNNILY